MSLLPIFVKLQGRQVLVVGAGNVALEKIGSLLKAGAQVRALAPEARDEVRTLAENATIEWIQRPFRPSDLDGFALVIAATDVPEVNAAVYREAGLRGVLCNSVDDIPNCDFFFGSVVRRGDLQIAISTAGESPAYAQRLRKEIDARLATDAGEWLSGIGNLRRQILATLPAGEDRKTLLHRLAQDGPAFDHPIQIANHAVGMDRTDSTRPEIGGQVFLVGAGPGDPDLLTVKATRLIHAAEVILHDDLVPQAILEIASHAEIVNVGKRCGTKRITQDEINAMMVEHARAGSMVVRLKCGDPLIFGRAAEEMDALRAAGIRFEVVPGITSALAAAAAIPASLTDRRAASNVTFSTGHHAQSHYEAAVPVVEDTTRVVYMPGRDLTLLSEEWMVEGLPAAFPCVLVSRAAQPDQVVRHTTLGELHREQAMEAPSILLAGWALAGAGERAAEMAVSAALSA